TKTNLIFLDACRDNPLAENLARSMGTRSAAVGRGLAKIGSGVGSLIAFSTQPGNVALDGKGRNSPFTTALLKHLGTPGESITDDLTAVRRDVLAATDGKQVPWDNSSLTGPVVLVKKPAEPKPEARAEPASPQVPSMPSNLAEITYWDTIKDSSDKSFFEAYLKRYPGGNYADLAKLKIAMIERAESTRQATKEAPANPVETAKLEQPAPADATPAIALDPVELAREMQTELNRLGCSVGTVDGVWGPGSERALKDYADRQGVKLASTDPTAEILDRLKATTIRVCPLVCGAGTEEKNGRCVNVRQQANIDSQPKGSKQKISEPQTGQTSARSDGRTCYLCFRSGIGKTEKVCARNYVELRDMLGNGCCSCKKL
ncbi:MAG: caspase family protein, partial [Salaquimonas sp.]|nr:caspase family protein [Salaquimonas sp.]